VRWLFSLATLAFLAAACSSASPAGSAAPEGSVPPVGGACSDLDITGPSGRHVSLTGAWRADDLGWYDILQRESCLYWMGMSPDYGSGTGDVWTNVFTATIRNDLTITGDWGDVPFNPTLPSDVLGNGALVLRIDFDETGDEERPVLRRVAESGDFRGAVWVLEESLSDPLELVGIFGGDEERQCAWVEANGERIELVGSGAWEFGSPLSIQDFSGHIAARIGDPIVVRGQLSTVLGQRCTDTAMLVEELDPTP
jgi:hypothetical protein